MSVELHWIPLGAGGRSVRVNGIAYEALRHRDRRPLFHAALVVSVHGTRHTIELAPCPDDDGARRGVVATGPVGSPSLGRLRLFRYELRCWRDGQIPDLAYAVGGPVRLSASAVAAERVLVAAHAVPTPTWGRDELHAGEGWNSNSVIAWLLETAGLPAALLRPPGGGRAPGWYAGIHVARRDLRHSLQPQHPDRRSPWPITSGTSPSSSPRTRTRRAPMPRSSSRGSGSTRSGGHGAPPATRASR
jgi:hypothetical protein